MAAALTLRSLAEKARRKSLPERHELVAAALEIGADALELTREYKTMSGEVREVASPLPNVAVKAVEVAALLALKEAPKPEQRPEELKDQLAAMGWELVKREPVAVAGSPETH